MTSSHPGPYQRNPRRKKVFYGWWIVLSGTLINIYSGGAFYYGFTAFFNPIRASFAGWSATVVALAMSLRSIETGIAAPVVGLLTDKVGPRKLMVSGTLIAGVGFILLSRINSLWSFYGAFLILSIGLSACSSLVMMTAVANWFKEKLGRAMGLLMVGPGVSGLLVPLLVWLIGQYGWRTTLVILGLGMWGLGIPLSLAMRHRPEQYGYLPDGKAASAQEEEATSPLQGEEEEDPPDVAEFTAREALRTRTFWLISLAIAMQMTALSAVIVHEMPYLTSIGFTRETAGLVVALTPLLSILGRLGCGWLGDIYAKRYVLALGFALQTIGLLIFAAINSVWLVIPFLLTFSPGYGGTIPLRAAIQAEYFGRSAFGSIQGVMIAAATVSGVVGPAFAGLVFDTQGSYRLAFYIIALLTFVGFLAALASKPPAPRAKA